MKNIKKTQKAFIGRAEKPSLDQDINTLADTLSNLHMMRSKLSEIETKAMRIGTMQFPPAVEVSIPSLAEFRQSPSRVRLQQTARELLHHFFQFNIVIWRAEQSFEPPTLENEPWRVLGSQLHEWYESLKRLVLFELELYPGDCTDPFFNEIFLDGLKRATAGEPIAIEFMRHHWGMQAGGSVLQSK
jgi:hypothetical protein